MNNFTFKRTRMNLLRHTKSLILFLFCLFVGHLLNAQCTPDVTPPLAACNANIQMSLASDGTATFTADILDENSWDDCGAVDLRLSILSGTFDPTNIPTSDEITFNCCQQGTHTVLLWVIDESGNLSNCWGAVTVEDIGGYCLSNPFDCTEKTISGNVFFDANQNCQNDSEAPTGEGKIVKATSYPDRNWQYEGTVDANGYYEITLPFDDGKDYEIEILGLPSQVLSCGNKFIKSIPNGFNELVQDFPIRFLEGCPYMVADISSLLLRRCFNNTVNISTCNYSDQFVDDAYVEIEFDQFLEVQSSTIPGTLIGGNVYQYDLGDLGSGECVNFSVEVLVNCDAELGQTHCIFADVFPQKECFETDPNWSGAIIQTTAECEGDSVKFIIENIGAEAMNQALDFTIVEDVVMYMDGQYNLEAGEFEVQKVPANGATWRMEAMQAPGYPEWLFPASWMEGCGGLNNTGMILQFSTATHATSSSRFCIENRGSFDPNDKQSFPRGYGDDHFIQQNREIDYLIRFQNTGTDTAFNVVVKDTLSQHLLWGSIRPGASSHPYVFKPLGDGVVEFVFEDIMLPDSSSNEQASHGFVQFKIQQQPDLADGIVIENSAAIYFDFNEPIITNTTWLTIGEEFVSASQNIFKENVKVEIMPNPFESSALFKIQGLDLKNGNLILMDATGRAISQNQFVGNEVRFYRNGLNSGLYFYQIKEGQDLIVTGKLLVR